MRPATSHAYCHAFRDASYQVFYHSSEKSNPEKGLWEILCHEQDWCQEHIFICRHLMLQKTSPSKNGVLLGKESASIFILDFASSRAMRNKHGLFIAAWCIVPVLPQPQWTETGSHYVHTASSPGPAALCICHHCKDGWFWEPGLGRILIMESSLPCLVPWDSDLSSATNRTHQHTKGLPNLPQKEVSSWKYDIKDTLWLPHGTFCISLDHQKVTSPNHTHIYFYRISFL